MLQLSDVECGAACLAMILNYHGSKVRVAECRERCGVGRDGLTARAVAEGARSYGLIVRAFSLQPAQLQLVPLPVIAHWGFDHFVVIERWTPKQVVVVDPAVGRRHLTPEAFGAGFTGVVLTLRPSSGFVRQAGTPPSWPRHLRAALHVPGVRRLLGQVLVAEVVLQGLGLVTPLLMQVLVDDVLPFPDAGLMPMLGLGMLSIMLAQCVTSFLRGMLLLYLQARLDAHLMLGFFEHVLTLPYRFFQQRTSGDLLTRLSSNAVIREALANQTLAALLDGVFVLGYLVLLLILQPSFGALILVMGLLQVGILLGTNQLIHGITRRELVAEAEAQGYLIESLSGIATVKSSGAEERVLQHWSSLFFRHMGLALHLNRVSATIEACLLLARGLALLGLLWIGAMQVLAGSMSLGTMLALNALAASFLGPLASLVSSGQRLQLAAAHLERIADVIEAKPEQDPDDAWPTPPLAGRIDLHDVSFRYDAHSPPALRDISLTIRSGQKVAIVGRTGSGKSTLAKLLLGLYEPDQGEIRFDGILLQDLDYRSLRRQFGVVPQEPTLFSGSIRENIAFNRPMIPFDRVVVAARLAGISDDVEQFPMGFETRVGEGGASLSGGQRQRVLLARALASSPAILVLDEATSHLDVTSEARVDANLSALRCTRIVIAHRLSTVRNADLILVVDHGRIVERGTHRTLLERGGLYADLVRTSNGSDQEGIAFSRSGMQATI
jgi:ABC-type bacteriocin/lantibiotic exporter with double-glycine peptidase domain